MANKFKLLLERTVSPANIWNIAEQCVLAAGGSLVGQAPTVYAPLDHWISGEDGLVRYYDILQDNLVKHGFDIGINTNPPLSYADISGKDFLDMIRAVDLLMINHHE
jgi:hypothetical protein